MKLSYDPRYNVAYLQLRSKSEPVESLKVSEELVVDVASDGTIYGIELLNANAQLRPGLEPFTFVNEATGEEVALPMAA